MTNTPKNQCPTVVICTPTACVATSEPCFEARPVPVGGPVMVGLMAVTVAMAAWCWLRKRAA